MTRTAKQPQPRLDLRGRRHEVLCRELAELAADLFAERGFEATTVDDIAAAAGISRRTFFRYFKTKEDVVLRRWDDMAERLSMELAARPKDEPPMTVVLRALQAVVDHYHTDPKRARALRRLCCTSPSLQAHRLQKQETWRARITKEVAARSSERGRRAWLPQLVAATALGALDVAAELWQADEKTSLPELLEQVFASLPKIGAG